MSEIQALTELIAINKLAITTAEKRIKQLRQESGDGTATARPRSRPRGSNTVEVGKALAKSSKRYIPQS